ncbi:hypothetical protein A8C56_14230 [Niabella ginsenosidivorans]|uniref:Outer membrane protein beta-barrel domain-containing protein n=1 Tax=Niabella ginsenosidivorans TaxID=1176587 RepID=A0A1A9I5M3_9BACT|nr:porin family protein [Niabella ginsenosidivorans]ANH81971.1 hypothetical protein A8C56_14230 [Niabella ginsenosidivorans]
MKMKNQLLKTLAVAIAAVTLSGSAMAQVEIGIRAGANFSNAAIKSGSNDWDTKLQPGWHAGLTFDIPVADEFYVQPGALYSSKGFKLESNGAVNSETKFNASYIEVPVNFLYKPEVGNGNLLLGVGPYLGIGLGGKVKGDFSAGSFSYSDDAKLQFVNDADDADNNKFPYAKPIDFGGNLLFGYEFANKLSVQLNGQLGLINVAPKNGFYDKMKTSQFGVSLGYKF